MVKYPAIFLSFDDYHIDEWYDLSPFLNQNNMKCTFYVTLSEQIAPSGWGKLKHLQDEGHTIGFHGTNHLRAAPEIEADGFEKFYEKEIAPGLSMFEENGLHTPAHYAYPMGNGNKISDYHLLKHFKTLRYGGREYIKDLKGQRIFHAVNFGKFENKVFSGHEKYVQEAIRRKAAVCLFMHWPVMKRLTYLARRAANFFAMDVLNELFSSNSD